MESPLGRLIVAVQDQQEWAALAAANPIQIDVPAVMGDLLRLWQSPTGALRRLWRLACDSVSQFDSDTLRELRDAHLALLNDAPDAARRPGGELDAGIVARHCAAVLDAQGILKDAFDKVEAKPAPLNAAGNGEGSKKKNADELLLAAAEKNREVPYFSVRQLAEIVPRSKSTIAASKTYKGWEKLRANAKAERQLKKAERALDGGRPRNERRSRYGE
jgi:hypothetical protein